MRRFFNRLSLTRLALAIAATVIIFLLLPRADHQSYSYELNQPWKYQLLTADFDMPIMRDSASAHRMRDSIDANFVPFVKRIPNVETTYVERFGKMCADKATGAQITLLTQLLNQVYSDGLVDPALYNSIHRFTAQKARVTEEENGAASVTLIDAEDMLTPAKAFTRIDSIYNAVRSASHPELSSDVVKALNLCLTPNVVVDTLSDTKFRNQEYLSVNGAQGVIKKGQRIVDRGEIITPQIFTNLNTYIDLLERTQRDDEHTYYYIGQALYIILCFTALYCFLHIYRNRFYSSLRKMVFLVSFITILVVFAILMFRYVNYGIYLVPFAMIPVVLVIFFDSRTAIFSLLIAVLLSALVATFQFNFIFLELTAGTVAAFSIHQLSKRSQLLRTALLTFLAYVVSYLIIILLMYGKLTPFSWTMIGIFAINAVILSFAYVLILVIEKIFGFTSAVTLVELSDINNPLLRRLAEEAPGTFQHSMQVSTLASEAARAIGANTQLVRTGALYHDIGKMESPVFFTENQHGVNPHAGLDPETSARKIISHVTDGLQTAAKEKLPEVIRDFISQHHGKGVTRYFYNTAVNENPDSEVDITKFQYPGPNPQSKETTILMMADAVEAASRSLKNYTKESIDSLVDKIIDQQMADGLFKESPISFNDIETVKNTFKKRLATIYHTRIAYPDIKQREEKTDDTSKPL